MADRALRFDLLGRDRTFGRTLDQSHRKLQRFGSGLTKLAALAGGAFAGIAITAGIKSTIDAASDLNESISKARVVFGKSSKAVELFAKTAAKNLGQSRQQALEATATFGNLFVSMKLGQKPAADMSVKIVRLASDLASFNNVKPEEALEALRSGLVGETEPLRRFGINLNDADLRQRALALGLTKTTKEVLPPAIKAQAAYSLIMEQSATAHGDFARTSKGAANQQRIFAARIADLKANIGKGLLPVFSLAVKFINEQLVPAVSRFATRVRENVGPAIAGLTGGIQEHFDRFKLDAKIFGRNLAARIKGTAQAVIVGFQVGLKTGDWGQLGGIIGNILRQAIGNGIDLIRRAFGGVDWFKVGKEAVFVAVPFALGFFDALLDALFKTAKEHPGAAAGALVAFIGPFGKAGGTIAKILEKIPFARAFAPLFRILESITAPLRKAAAKLGGLIGQGLREGMERVFPTAAKTVRGRIGDLGAWIALRAEAFRKLGARMIRLLAAGIGEEVAQVVKDIGRVIAAITRPFRGAAGWLIRRGREVIQGLGSGIVGKLGDVAAWMGRVVSSTTRPFRGAIGWLYQAGRNVLHGFWEGLISKWQAVKEWFLGIPAWIKEHKGPLSLDRKLLFPAGAAIMGGFAKGLKSGAKGAMDFVTGIVGDIWGLLSGGLSGIGQSGTSGNLQKLAQRMAAGYGWTGAQWTALRNLVQNESGWNPNAQNPTSTAYGLFQFLNSTWASVGATKTSSPVGQIAAGLRYIKSRYGSPSAAYGAWLSRSPHWYGEGGIFTKPTVIGVGERGPEAVIPLGRGNGGGNRELARMIAEELAKVIPTTIRVDDMHTGLLSMKRGRGRIKLGLD